MARLRLTTWLIAFFLVLVTIALYWPATSHDFVNYDDDMYVKDNTHVTSGLTLGNARWAFRTDYAGNWHPVTWLPGCNLESYTQVKCMIHCSRGFRVETKKPRS